MPSEKRTITFSLAEINIAIQIKCTADGMDRPPEGEVTYLDVKKGKRPKPDHVVLTIKAKDNTEHTLSYNSGFFELALIFFCRGSGIPLPNKPRKKLKVLPDKVIMEIEMEN